ncbi:MAG: TetR/AcrR family transcriptional regulator [Rubrobacteraceae bacterium]
MKGKSGPEPRKLPQQARSREMVEIILAATARVLVREGYDGMTTNRVAEVAGVSVGSIYQYFPNKESLLATLMRRHLDEMLAVFEEKFSELAEMEVEDAVRALIRAAVQAHAVEPRLHRAFVEQVPLVGGLGMVREVEARIEERLREYLEDRREQLAPRDLHLAAFLVYRVVESATHAAGVSRPGYFEDGRLADELTTLVLGYLVPGRVHQAL